MYALTDEAYALTAARPGVELGSARILWLQGFCQGYWVAGSVAGALLGSWLAIDLAGLAFTLTALFVVLALEAVRAERDLPTPVLAFLCAPWRWRSHRGRCSSSPWACSWRRSSSAS